MTRVLIALTGVVLLAITALAVVWLAGELLAGLGGFVVGASVVLWKLLWFLVLTGVLGGLVFFVTSAWRPAPAVRHSAPRPDHGQTQGSVAGGSGPVASVTPAAGVTERLVFTPDLPTGGPVREEL